MADGQGITWGGMIKGAVKITAAVAVTAAIVAAASWGTLEIAEMLQPADVAAVQAGGEAATTAGSVAGVGAAIMSSLTGITSAIVDVVTAPFEWTASLFNDSNTLGNETKLEVTKPSEIITPGNEEYDPRLAENAAENMAELNEAFADIKTELNTQVTSAITEAESALAVDPTNEQLVQHVEALKNLSSELDELSVPLGTAEMQAVVDSYNEVIAGEAQIKGLAATLEGNAYDAVEGTDAKPDLENANKVAAIANGHHIDDLSDTLGGLVADFNHANGEHLLKNVPETLAAVGAATVAAGAVHRAGRRQGWRDYVNEQRSSSLGFGMQQG